MGKITINPHGKANQTLRKCYEKLSVSMPSALPSLTSFIHFPQSRFLLKFLINIMPHHVAAKSLRYMKPFRTRSPHRNKRKVEICI